MDFTELVDLAAERLGGAVLYASDDFFAPKENLLKASAPVFREGEYTDRGKWMDGWESRRRRTPGYDWCIIRLGLPGMIRGVVVDTSYFKGNYPEQCSLEACAMDGHPNVEKLLDESVRWVEVLPVSQLSGDSMNPFTVEHFSRATHLRFKIYPDGGVARLRVYGEVVPDWTRIKRAGLIDLASVEHGGLVLASSDMFFGHRHNLIMPGRSTHMGDGWETRRRRGPGHDWTIVKLATRGTLHRVEIDTDHYKGNAPGRCMVEVCDATNVPNGEVQALAARVGAWRALVHESPLQPHSRHRFTELAHHGPATHARLNIYPDGGIARMRLYGMPEQA